MANRGSTWLHPGLISLYSSIAIMLFVPDPLHAQAKGTVSQNPVNPLAVNPIGFRPFPNYAKPVDYLDFDGGTIVSCPPQWWERWSLTLSGSYQFLNQRSRVGDVSLDSESGVIDLAAAYNCRPYTVFDLAYAYSHANGSSPEGISDTVNQHVGSVHVLQPLEPLFPQCKDWKPATLSGIRPNHQFAIILGADYGNSSSSTDIPRSRSVHNSADTLLGTALLDYQFACFSNRQKKSTTSSKCTNDDYATFFFELSSGIQVDKIWLDSSDRRLTSSGRQLTYRNIATLDFSFYKRFGFLVAAEWDAPLDSEPLHASPRYYANTATFTGGLTYNYYVGKLARTTSVVDSLQSPDRWSVSILYSYTAFDPFTESNQLQVRVSYTF